MKTLLGSIEHPKHPRLTLEDLAAKLQEAGLPAQPPLVYLDQDQPELAREMIMKAVREIGGNAWTSTPQPSNDTTLIQWFKS